ncbi:hypothetical protein SLA2020_112380 [Shorea laevis]
MSTFSPDLVSDILLRLPVKTLLRLRCVSKSLCNEIDSPEFVKNNLNKSMRNRIRQKLIVNNRNCSHFYALDFDGGFKKATTLKYPFRSSVDTPIAIGGSCNGLILFVLGKSSKLLALWNPSTRRCKKIPPCPVVTLPNYVCTSSLGLGHDPAHDDYKIVMISGFSEYRHYWHQSWVFSLKKNSWRRSPDAPTTMERSKSSFANGALYWQSNSDDRCNMVGFDLTNEVYFKIPLFVDSGLLINTTDTRRLYFYYDNMVVFGGEVYTTNVTAESKTLEFYLEVSDKSRIGRWKKAFEMEDEVMEKDLNDEDDEHDLPRFGLRDSRHLELPCPLAYSKDGDSILGYKKNEVFWYNPETKSRQRVEILGIPKAKSHWYNLLDNCFEFHVCWESLVSLGNEGVFDAAPKMSSIETLREIAENLTGLSSVRLACIFFLSCFGVWSYWPTAAAFILPGINLFLLSMRVYLMQHKRWLFY